MVIMTSNLGGARDVELISGGNPALLPAKVQEPDRTEWIKRFTALRRSGQTKVFA